MVRLLSTTVPPHPVFRKLKHTRDFSQVVYFEYEAPLEQKFEFALQAAQHNSKLQLSVRSLLKSVNLVEHLNRMELKTPFFFLNAAQPQSRNRFSSCLCQTTHLYVTVCTLNTIFEVMPPDKTHNSVLKCKQYN